MKGVLYLDYIFIVILLYQLGIHCCKGDCRHNGRSYLKHTVWQPDPCTVCTCEDPIVLCETIRCTDPLCHYNKGEYLQISADSCCPECVANQTSCLYHEQSIPHNTEWNKELCVRCKCDAGTVNCGQLPCPDVNCRQGEISQTLPGHCCPTCIPAGRPCEYNGEQHSDGSSWSNLPCTTCTCTDGQQECYPIHCLPIVCAETEILELLPGACCPSCHGLNSTCREGDMEYMTGEQWNREPCTLCVCIGGAVVCTHKECVDSARCTLDDVRLTRPGECCPECVPRSGVCDSETPIRYSGDLWNVSDCEYCMCDHGNVRCHKAVCENVVCLQEEVLLHQPGVCCPVCVIPPSCEVNGQLHTDGSRWLEDGCTECHCDGGVSRCYTQHCTKCPPGMPRVPIPGECCGVCQKVTCSPECADCESNAPSNCTVCTNTQLLVQDGRCLHTCRMGFYPSPSGTCLPCDNTCYTCSGGTAFHCDMCRPGLMWKHGECVTQCGLGYYLQNGRCLECARSCKSCNGPGQDQCVSCSHLAQVVYHGECLDECPDNFFIRGGKCVACHPTCKTCTPDGLSCASCWQGGLLHLGQCVTRCSVGYYSNPAGSCSPCHPACESCDGGTSKNCTSCYPGHRISRKGRCRSLCEEKTKYMTLEGTCKPCERGCSECHEAWSGQGSVCSACQDRQQMPFGKTCVDKCKSGYFTEHKACKPCGDDCAACTSPTTCTKCTNHMLLYQGQCVEQCGQKQYEDGPSLSCRDCSSHCLQCYSVEECSVCDSSTYLKNGHCVQQCGKGFIPDSENRECRRNTGPPIFKILNHIEVPDGDIISLEPSMFFISDPDTSLEHLLVTMVTAPSNGDLVKVREGKDVKVTVGGNVTVDDIIQGKVRFRHRSGKFLRGKATFLVSDTQLNSPSGDLYFQAIQPSAITIATRSLLLATKEAVTTLTTAVLDLNTMSDPTNVKLTVLQGPKEGHITAKGMSVRVFTLAELRSKVIGYRHNVRGDTGADSVLLQASDGFHITTFLFDIEIREKENTGPILMHNKVGHVLLGDMLQISPDLLLAKIPDETGTQHEEVVFTLVPPLNNPQDGEIIMVVPIPESGVSHSWEDLGNGNMAARMTRFLQRDIDEGRIWYKSRGNMALTEVIKFNVAETGSASQVLEDQTFQITVREKKYPGPITHPTLVDGVRLNIRVLEKQLVPITSANLAFQSPGVSAAGIQYVVTQPLGNHDGLLEHVEYPSLHVLNFTQADVDSNRIIYRPPDREFGYTEKDVFFYFTVSNGKKDVAIQEHKYVITLVPVNNRPPRFMSPIPILYVSQGGTIPIGHAIIDVYDEDTRLTNLTVTLTRAPHNGQLEKVDGAARTAIKQGDSFAYAEIEKNLFQYSHAGSPALYDTMQISVSDGPHVTSTSIDVKVVRVHKSAPRMDPSSTCRLVVREGTTSAITKNVLLFIDADDPDNGLSITLTMATTHGKLLLSNQEVMLKDTFTQADINDGRLSFLADSEIGKKAVTEVLTFNVTDSSGNVLPEQTLTVLIEPDNNLPPRVKVNGKVKVSEGGHVTLSSDQLDISDPDTDLSDLTVVIETPPGYGIIKDISPVEGSVAGDDHVVTSFRAVSVSSGYIQYSQTEHEGLEPAADSFVLVVTDGQNRSPSSTVSIEIQGVNDEAPHVVSEQVFVQEGQRVTVTNTSVFITDLDTPPQHLDITLQTSPEQGTLRRKESKDQSTEDAELLLPQSTFTYQDILDELVVYVHGGSEVTVDSFSLQVTDGVTSVQSRVPVIVGLVNDEAPRVTVNRGLRVHPGTTTKIQMEDLRSTDVDSENSQLIYTVTRDTRIGAVFLTSRGQETRITSQGPDNTFKQRDINKGHVEYRHSRGETTGNVVFKFTVADPEGNVLIDQDFYITVLDDRVPPREVTNRELVCEEGGQVPITTDYLSYVDDDSDNSALLYVVLTPPTLGHLELTRNPGVAIQEFSQTDLAASALLYKHTSSEEAHTDSFTFSVTDGTNNLVRTFHINVRPVDDSIPVVTCNRLRAQEGVRKLISEFHLKAKDEDTKEDFLLFTIVQSPSHGRIEVLTAADDKWTSASSFSMAQIYENQVSYKHDGGETTADSFTFTVTDGTNDRFVVISNRGQFTVPNTQPQELGIEITPVDDGTPVIVANLGLQFLEVLSSGAGGNIITQHELHVQDSDTGPDKIKFVVRAAPQSGRLERTDNPGVDMLTFTQADIDNSLVRYILTSPAGTSSYSDSFTFDVYDSRPNRVADNTFHITWSTVEFAHSLMNVTEQAGVIEVPIVRRGNLKQYSIVTCHTLSGTATSSQQGSRPGQQDFVQDMTQVQFDEWQDKKTCTFIINDDSIFEGREIFYVELLQPSFTLLGNTVKTTVTIEDLEDEPVLQFQESEYHVSEGDSYLSANIVRLGDISSTVSTICFTSSLTARGSPLDRLDSGSDYISRGNSNSYRVIFPSGVSIATCDVKLIDDSLNEPSEQFELELTSPSYGSRLGPVSQATVIIDGPNDESTIHFAQSSYHFSEDAGVVDIEIERDGTDLTHTSTVWCATRLSNPPSASAGLDYVPSSSQITFGPSQTTQTCQLTLLDDDVDPRMEGDETFLVFLSSAISSNLIQPYTAIIHIQDNTLDIPTMQFSAGTYTVEESDQVIHVPIFRSGDTSFTSSVVCYTRQDTALVTVDYVERHLAEESRIVFKPGERWQNCTVQLVDDDVFEADEMFQLRLAQPLGTDTHEARLGATNSTVIIISNKEDSPRIQFEKPAYSIPEPNAKDQISTITLRVVRTGDASAATNVRCSTQDGSAMSGTDYNPKSTVIEFPQGVRSVDFTIDILYNSDIEWHETFSVVLGPDQPVGAELGLVATVKVTILDNDVSGSLILPAPPIVVSLLKYEDAEAGMKIDASPGYPLVCITPCDSHHPSFDTTEKMCRDAGIDPEAMYYRWEVAIPDYMGTRAPFVEISYNTLFTSVNSITLDSIYFRPSFKVRCIAQPIDDKRNPGMPLKSNPVTIGRDNGICNAPVFSGLPFSYQAQSFHAKLDYVSTEDPLHPNTIHISVKIPHQDGMLPLISTFPITNLKYVLSEPVYRQQHICSNIITPEERTPLLTAGFLLNATNQRKPLGSGFDYPFQFDANLRGNNSLMLYKYLDLKSCMWNFEAWYHMTDLVDLCGGRAVSDFQVKGRGQTYLSVRVPLYVSYLYAVAPIGWGSLEHRTEMEFSFYYDTVLWQSGLQTTGQTGGRLQVMRILIGDDGRMVVDFKTQAKFRGLYVLEHPTLPGYTSRFISPDKAVTFDLDLVWGQNTFDGPHQLWRATSQFSFKDYTGEYKVELIPCTVQSNQGYTIHTPQPCTAHQPLRFDVPIAFQQTNRPVPLEYTLDTHFQITSSEVEFLTNPFKVDTQLPRAGPHTHMAFNQGDRVYGRVMWSPDQDLKEAYTLMLDKVFICAGLDGYTPTYDPTGTVYNNGPQYGCMRPGPNLKYRFIVLDRSAPHLTSKSFQGVGFDAQFVSENTLYSSLAAIPGVDGFILSADPLYKITSGFQWYLQVIYSIGPTNILFRRKRSALLSLARRNAEENIAMKYDWLENNSSKNGTNIQVLYLNNTQVEEEKIIDTDNESTNWIPLVVISSLLAVIILIGVCCFVIILRKRRRKRQHHKALSSTSKRNNLDLPQQGSVIYKGKPGTKPVTVVRSSASLKGLELKESVVYKADHGKTNVRVKDTNIQKDKNIARGNGTEV